MRIVVKPSLNLLALSYGWNRSDDFSKYKKMGHFSLFLLESMSRTPLPSFSYQGKKHWLQKDRVWYGNFQKDLKSFFDLHGSKIRKGLEEKTYAEEKEFPIKLRQLLKSFGNYQPPCKNVVLCPNIFGVPGEGYGPLIGQTAYAIFTPNSKKNQTWLMVHEVCHSLLLPIFQSEKIKKLIKQTEPLMTKWSTKQFRTYYPRWEWMIEEYMIHAIEQYVTGSSIKEKMSWGMKRLPYFVSSWIAFQKRAISDKKLSIEDWVTETLHALALETSSE